MHCCKAQSSIWSSRAVRVLQLLFSIFCTLGLNATTCWVSLLSCRTASDCQGPTSRCSFLFSLVYIAQYQSNIAQYQSNHPLLSWPVAGIQEQWVNFRLRRVYLAPAVHIHATYDSCFSLAFGFDCERLLCDVIHTAMMHLSCVPGSPFLVGIPRDLLPHLCTGIQRICSSCVIVVKCKCLTAAGVAHGSMHKIARLADQQCFTKSCRPMPSDISSASLRKC